MKLARPDVFHPRIVLAGCPALREGDGDDAGLIDALRGRGLHARWLSWDDPATLEADVVILRATCDYLDRLEEFLDWTRRVPHLLNSADVVAWNSDRRYLRDLAAAGVPMLSGAALRQRYHPRLEEDVTALVFLRGEASHAFAKNPVDPSLGPADPDFALWDVGHAALAAAAGHLGTEVSDLLYARVDILGGILDDTEQPVLLELHLVEPSLGWRQLGDTERRRRQRQFAVSVESALDGFGLGPLSHRRP